MIVFDLSLINDMKKIIFEEIILYLSFHKKYLNSYSNSIINL